jgi:DNA mismatch endonuclease (patch repair protein)|nr:MAG TPA: DNA G:T-mismatch repair endonuclease [Caudoviricetes sp.]
MDVFTPEKRSLIMARIKGKNTRPEKRVRSLLHAMGYRFRLHRKDLPGTPDIVLPKYGAVVFVHGCFWHQHPGCKRASIPTSNEEFWQKKLAANKRRDALVEKELNDRGWKVIIIWECELKNLDSLCERIGRCLPRAQSLF